MKMILLSALFGALLGVLLMGCCELCFGMDLSGNVDGDIRRLPPATDCNPYVGCECRDGEC